MLTPNHFLVGHLGEQLAPQDTHDIVFNPRNRWKLIHQRSREEFVSALKLRKKWREAKDNLKVGDVVLVVDQNAPRGQWHLGQVEEVFPGQDGQERLVQVSTSTGSQST